MTDNVKIMFENETLINASPATVSRCGIIYVSQSDLGWTSIVQAWAKRSDSEPELLKKKQVILQCFYRYMGDNETPADAGKMFDFLSRKVEPVMNIVIAGVARACCTCNHQWRCWMHVFVDVVIPWLLTIVVV